MPGASSADFSERWTQRVIALWQTKLWLSVVISVGFWVPYLVLSRHAWLPVHSLPLTWIDRWAGFQPQPWAWVYESNFLVTGIVPWLITRRDVLRRYVLGFGLMAVVCFAIFLLFPVASPRPTGLDNSAFMLLFARVDGPLNAFPSLHAGSLVYSLALARRMFRGRLHPAVVVGGLLWGSLILFATLATKQHYAVDLLAGALIGCLADRVAWRHSSSEDSAEARIRRNVGTTSQVG